MASHLLIPHSLRVAEVLTVLLAFGLSTLVVLIRVYTKIRVSKSMLLEDYFSVLAWLGFASYIGLGIVIGQTPEGVIYTGYLSQIETQLYSPVIVFVKVSILLQYMTIFLPHRSGPAYYAIHILIWTNVLYYTISTFVEIFQCSPRKKLWDPKIPGHCINDNHGIQVYSGSLNVLSDFSILVLPLPLIWRLQMPFLRKLRVTAVFSVGLFACITSVVRLTYSIDLLDVPVGNATYLLDMDKIGLWSFAEIASGIIAGCMPALAKFCKHCSGGSISSLFKSRKPSNSGSDQTRRSWRRLFISRSKSTALGDSGDETLSAAGRFFTSSKNKSKAPYLSTMNFSGNFFPSTEKDLSTVSSVSSGGVESEQANTNNFVPVKGDDIESAPALTGVTKTVHVEVASLGPCTDSQTSTSFSKDPA